jgi:hypothetical protein
MENCPRSVPHRRLGRYPRTAQRTPESLDSKGLAVVGCARTGWLVQQAVWFYLETTSVDFHGSLDEFHIPDIIQFLSGAGKTGVLRLVSRDEEGEVYLQNGRIRHAVFGDLAGEEAVYSLFLISTGRFDFEPDVTTDSSTVSGNNTNLLMEAVRRKDEWDNVISHQIPNVDVIPEFVLPDKNDTGKQITLNTSEWIVLSKIDGKRNLRAIAKDAKLSVYQTCRLLYGLVSTGLIRFRDPESPDEHDVSFPD